MQRMNAVPKGNINLLGHFISHIIDRISI